MKRQLAVVDRQRARCCLIAWLLLIVWGTSAGLSVAQDAAQRDERGQPSADASDQERPPSPETPTDQPITALIGAEVRTCDAAGVLPGGVVLIQAGKILAVGDASLAVPDEAHRIDLSGCVLTPGLIDARSELWLSPASADATASDASLRAVDGIDPFAEQWHETIRHGITTVYIQPSRRGTLSGFGAVVAVAPDPQGQPVVHADRAALQASLGIGASTNRSRQQQFDRTRNALEAALDYQKKWREYEEYVAKQKAEQEQAESSKANQAETKPGEKSKESDEARDRERPAGAGRGGPQRGRRPDAAESKQATAEQPAESTDEKSDKSADAEKAQDAKKPPQKPDRDPTKDLLVQVLEGELPLRLEIHDANDYAFALKLLEDEKFQKLQVIFDGLSDLQSAADAVRQRAGPLVLGPWLSSEPLNDPVKQSQQQWGKQFSDYAGVLALATFGSQGQSTRLLRAHAAVAVAHGLPPERALRAVTCDAARVLGLSSKIGSITAGKAADLACFEGEPIDPSSRVRLVISQGTVVFAGDAPAAAQPAAAGSTAAGAESSALAVVELDGLPGRLPAHYAVRSNRCWLNGELRPATIVVQDGTIAAIAQAEDVTVTARPVFDVGDAVITPGLVSGHAQLGLQNVIDPAGLPDASYVIAADGVAAGLERGPRLVREGVLRVLLAPGGANPIAGTCSLIRLADVPEVEVREAAAKLVLAASARNPDRFPSSLAGQVQMLDQSLAGLLATTRLYVPPAVEQNLGARRRAAVGEMVTGKRLVVIEARSDAEVRAALDLVERYQLRAALLGARQLRPFIERIKGLKMALLAEPVAPGDYNWVSQDLAAAAAAGIPVAFTGESAEPLRMTAALAVTSGMSPAQAMEALCDPLPALLGTTPAMAANASADLVIWSDVPLNLAARPLAVIVNGQLNPDN